MELPDHDHFDIGRAPGDPESPLAQAAVCREHGIECEYMELPDHDHFDIGRAPGDPESPLAQAMLRMMGL